MEPSCISNDKTGHVKSVCLCDDVAAAESGLAGFLREGRESRDRHREKEKEKSTETSFSSLYLTFLCINLLLLVWTYWVLVIEPGFGTR